MPTVNINVSSAWTKIADASNSEFLATCNTPVSLEIATTAADVAPTVNGHMLSPDFAITRNLIGAGFVWVKTCSGSIPSTVSLVVSK